MEMASRFKGLKILQNMVQSHQPGDTTIGGVKVRLTGNASIGKVQVKLYSKGAIVSFDSGALIERTVTLVSEY